MRSFFGLTNTFKNCISLQNIKINNAGNPISLIMGTGTFAGCKLGPAQLQQLTVIGDIKGSGKFTTTIGYDPELVDPSVDKPEGSEQTWAEVFAAKKWVVTWEAYVAPVENAPKLLMAKAPKQKLYKLDEIPDEMVDIMGNLTVYTKDGKHYLMTSGDSVTAPGLDGVLLRDTEIENVVWASNLNEALDKLGVVPVSE